MNNKNFISVESYGLIRKDYILSANATKHLNERSVRLAKAFELDANSVIDHCFLVDKGHRDGKEIHCVSSNGIIYILNRDKFLSNRNALITALIARPNQVKRLYRECNLFADKSILDKCYTYERLGYNLI